MGLLMRAVRTASLPMVMDQRSTAGFLCGYCARLLPWPPKHGRGWFFDDAGLVALVEALVPGYFCSRLSAADV